jgi:hypothetical protein
VYRATTKSRSVSAKVDEPTTVIVWSPSTTAVGRSSLAPMSVSTIPPVPKLESSVPSAWYRTMPKSCSSPVSAPPTSRIVPSDLTAIAYARSCAPPKSVSTNPPEPKPVSSVPSALSRATAKSALPVIVSAE